jgi:hypothetical protein
MKFRTPIFAVALAAAACTDSSPAGPTPVPQPPTPAIRVSGRVVDYHTGAGVPGISIRWASFVEGAGAGQGLPLPIVSDANGRYEVALPVADYFTYSTSLSNTGFPILTSGIIRVPGKRLETDLLVNPGTCAVRYGMVFDAVTREPIPGAVVSRAGTATTDAQGRYRLEMDCQQRGPMFWGIGTTTIGASHPRYQGDFEFDGRREHTGVPGIRRVDFALMPLP